MRTYIALSIAVLAFAVAGAVAADREPAAAQAGKSQTVTGTAGSVQLPGGRAAKGCDGLPDAKRLKQLVAEAPNSGDAGGFAGAHAEWAAVVNREGVLCTLVVATSDPAAAWPGSKGIAIAKAFTANGFSSDTIPMSTARLYTMSLPGHSLWSAANGNPLNPQCLTAPSQKDPTGQVCGGTIAFAGGLPLYNGKTRIGGLGPSGDTPCADHEVAKRMRRSLKLDPPTGPLADDIVYAGVDPPSIYAHPLCPNTWRNGEHIGDEGTELAGNGIARPSRPGAPPAPSPTPAASGGK